jgi:hypothetical protein
MAESRLLWSLLKRVTVKGMFAITIWYHRREVVFLTDI